jgi:hypothetical protein
MLNLCFICLIILRPLLTFVLFYFCVLLLCLIARVNFVDNNCLLKFSIYPKLPTCLSDNGKAGLIDLIVLITKMVSEY